MWAGKTQFFQSREWLNLARPWETQGACLVPFSGEPVGWVKTPTNSKGPNGIANI